MLTIVDAVTSLAGIDPKVDAWGADVVYSGTQKCLSSLPGIAPITFSPDAVVAITSRTHKVQSWFLDMNLIMGYWGEGQSVPTITPHRSTQSMRSTSHS